MKTRTWREGGQSFRRTDEADGGRKLDDLPCTDSTTPQGGGSALLSTPAINQIRRRRWWPTGDCVHCSTCYRTTNQLPQPGSRLSPKPATTRRTLASEVKWPRRFERILGARTFRTVSSRWLFLLLFRGCGGWDSRGIAYYDLGFACVYVILEWWSSGGAQTWGTRRSKWHSFFFCGVWFLE